MRQSVSVYFSINYHVPGAILSSWRESTTIHTFTDAGTEVWRGERARPRSNNRQHQSWIPAEADSKACVPAF